MGSGFWTKLKAEMRAPDSLWRNKALIWFAVILAYASVWPNKFVFDDILLIRDNAFLKTPAGLLKIFFHRNTGGVGLHVGFYRPVPMAVHFFIYWFSYQLHAFLHIPMTFGFHALNIFLQALNGCLLLTFGIRAGFNRNAVLAAALLWAVHPLHTEAVTYMSSTPELMWSTFCLLGLITLLPKEAPTNGIVDPQKAFSPRKIKLSLILFTLAMLSKESAVVFPALATATLFFISKERTRLSTYLKTWPLWLFSLGYILIIIFFILTPENGPLNPAYVHIYKSSIAVRTWTALGTLPTYARLIIWPEGLHYRRVAHICTSLWNWHSLSGLIIVLAVLLQILWGRARRGLALSFGFLWFAAAQAPNTGIVTPIDAVISEHLMYLPTMGLFLGVMQTLSPLFHNKRITAILLITTMTIALGTATFQQNMKWRNINTLYQNTKQHGGSLIIMNIYESNFLIKQHRFSEARHLLQNSLNALPESDADAKSWMHETIGLTWLHIPPKNGHEFTVNVVRNALPDAHHIDKAISELKTAIRLNPHNYWAHKFLAIIYTYSGDKKLAAQQDKIAQKLKLRDK